MSFPQEDVTCDAPNSLHRHSALSGRWDHHQSAIHRSTMPGHEQGIGRPKRSLEDSHLPQSYRSWCRQVLAGEEASHFSGKESQCRYKCSSSCGARFVDSDYFCDTFDPNTLFKYRLVLSSVQLIRNPKKLCYLVQSPPLLELQSSTTRGSTTMSWIKSARTSPTATSTTSIDWPESFLAHTCLPKTSE